MEAEVAIEKVQQNTAQRQQFEAAYQQTCRAIAALYEFAPPEEGQKAELKSPRRIQAAGALGALSIPRNLKLVVLLLRGHL